MPSLGLSPWREFEAIKSTDHQQERPPPHVSVQVEEDHGMQGRIHKLINPRSQDQRAVDGQRDADKKPDGNHVLRLRLPENLVTRKSAYQKIMFSATKTTVTTAAQKRGFWYRGTSPMEGTSVSPYTKPVNSLSGIGFVARLTTTVTTTHTIKDQSA